MNKESVEAGRRYASVLERYPESHAAPEALYWKAVSRYKATNDYAVLGGLPGLFKEKYPDGAWAVKTLAWIH